MLLIPMAQRGELEKIGRGLYSLPVERLLDQPLHPFEIGLKLARRGAISHYSAMGFHNLMDQDQETVYLTAPRLEGSNLSTNNDYEIGSRIFHIKRVRFANFFGVQKYFIGSVPIFVTDLEKTLLDALTDTRLCGGFVEVMHAFDAAKINTTLYLRVCSKGARCGCKKSRMDP